MHHSDTIEATFELGGETIPADHGYALYNALTRLPGIGERSAQRIALHLLQRFCGTKIAVAGNVLVDDFRINRAFVAHRPEHLMLKKRDFLHTGNGFF